ncbi:MAG TPA: hypothetical protein VJ032_03785 [Thermoanaerobaculia bacterium]|nr:hypothetical protein [Thermoanaerobaculia bacterium]
MNRWAFRILGLLLLLAFALMFINLERQLVKLRERRDPAPATTTNAPLTGTTTT